MDKISKKLKDLSSEGPPRFHIPIRENGLPRHTFLSRPVSGHLSRHLASPFRIMPMLSPCGHFEKPLSNIRARNKRLGCRFPPLLLQQNPLALPTFAARPFFLSRVPPGRGFLFSRITFFLRFDALPLSPSLHGDRFVSRLRNRLLRESSYQSLKHFIRIKQVSVIDI